MRLVRLSNLGPILYRFRDISGFFVLMTPALFHRCVWVLTLDQVSRVGVNPSMYFELFSREIIFEVFQPMWSRYRLTDRQTDRQMDDLLWHHRALPLCVASRGNKRSEVEIQIWPFRCAFNFVSLSISQSLSVSGNESHSDRNIYIVLQPVQTRMIAYTVIGLPYNYCHCSIWRVTWTSLKVNISVSN